MKTIKGPQNSKQCPTINGIFIQKMDNNWYTVSFPANHPHTYHKCPVFKTYQQAFNYIKQICKNEDIYLNEQLPLHCYDPKKLLFSSIVSHTPYAYHREYQLLMKGEK